MDSGLSAILIKFREVIDDKYADIIFRHFYFIKKNVYKNKKFLMIIGEFLKIIRELFGNLITKSNYTQRTKTIHIVNFFNRDLRDENYLKIILNKYFLKNDFNICRHSFNYKYFDRGLFDNFAKRIDLIVKFTIFYFSKIINKNSFNFLINNIFYISISYLVLTRYCLLGLTIIKNINENTKNLDNINLLFDSGIDPLLVGVLTYYTFIKSDAKNKNKINLILYSYQHGMFVDEFHLSISNKQFLWPSSKKILKESPFNLYNDLKKSSFYISPQYKKYSKDYSYESQPVQIYIISQTHTDTFGFALSTFFQELTDNLITINKNRNLLLLHPQELNVFRLIVDKNKNNILYPPHDLLKSSNKKNRSIVVGICSTALIECAKLGHFVIGFEIEPQESISAYKLYKPIVSFDSVNKVNNYIKNLLISNKKRAHHIHLQNEWINKIFN